MWSHRGKEKNCAAAPKAKVAFDAYDERLGRCGKLLICDPEAHTVGVLDIPNLAERVEVGV